MTKSTPGYIALISLFLFAAILIVGIIGGWIQVLKPGQEAAIIKRLDRIDGQVKTLKENQVTTDTLEKTLKGTLENIDYRTRIRQLKIITADRRGGNWIDRINSRLAGTPMAGMGRQFVISAADYGLPPNLSVAIALHESGAGRFTPPGSLNPFGMTAGTAPGYGVAMGKGADGTRPYQAFPSWETAIKEHAAFIARTWPSAGGPEDLRGYAVSSSWLGGVRGQMKTI